MFHNAAVTRQILHGMVGSFTICQNAFVHYRHFMLEAQEAFAVTHTFMRLIKNIELLLKCLETPLHTLQESIVSFNSAICPM